MLVYSFMHLARCSVASVGLAIASASVPDVVPVIAALTKRAALRALMHGKAVMCTESAVALVPVWVLAIPCAGCSRSRTNRRYTIQVIWIFLWQWRAPPVPWKCWRIRSCISLLSLRRTAAKRTRLTLKSCARFCWKMTTCQLYGPCCNNIVQTNTCAVGDNAEAKVWN